MPEELKAVALRPLTADGKRYEAGMEIPGALAWRALDRLVETGYVAVMPRGAKSPLSEYPEKEIVAHLRSRGYKVTRTRRGDDAANSCEDEGGAPPDTGSESPPTDGEAAPTPPEDSGTQGS